MRRRDYLALLSAALLPSGCLSSSDESSETTTVPESSTAPTSPPGSEQDTNTESTTMPSDTADRPAISTPEPGECSALSPPTPDSREGFPDPRTYPDAPDSLTADAVDRFARSYETALRYNRILADLAASDDCVDHLSVDVVESSVDAVPDGFTSPVTTRASYTGVPCADWTGTETQTPPPHRDLGRELAEYYATDRFVLRNGVAVVC